MMYESMIEPFYKCVRNYLIINKNWVVVQIKEGATEENYDGMSEFLVHSPCYKQSVGFHKLYYAIFFAALSTKYNVDVYTCDICGEPPTKRECTKIHRAARLLGYKWDLDDY